MSGALSRPIAMMAVLACAACAPTTQYHAWHTKQVSYAVSAAPDSLRVTLADKTRYVLNVPRLAGDSVIGFGWDRKCRCWERLAVDTTALGRIEVREFDAGLFAVWLTSALVQIALFM